MKTSTAVAIVVPVVLAGGGLIAYLVLKKDEEPVGMSSAALSTPAAPGGVGGLLDSVLGGGTGQAVGVLAAAAGDVVAQNGGRVISAIGKEVQNAYKPIVDVARHDVTKLVVRNVITGGLYSQGQVVKAGLDKGAAAIKSDVGKTVALNVATGGLYTPAKVGVSATKKVYSKVKGWF
jgi:hypothetical protein